MVRVIPSGGPNGSAKPIQKTNSTGSRTKDSDLGAGGVGPDHHAEDNLRSAHRQEAHQEWRAGGNADPLEGPLAVRREPHEGPHLAGLGEVPDPEQARQPEAESEHHGEQTGGRRACQRSFLRPGWASSCLASVSVSHSTYFSSLHP